MHTHKLSHISYSLFKKKFNPVFLLLLLAAGLIILGIILHENAETQRNANYLCLDCLGIS